MIYDRASSIRYQGFRLTDNRDRTLVERSCDECPSQTCSCAYQIGQLMKNPITKDGSPRFAGRAFTMYGISTDGQAIKLRYVTDTGERLPDVARVSEALDDGDSELDVAVDDEDLPLNFEAA